jgi:peptidoglycan/xylan/chitin deacetylase (PgdA/CDA1 family)
MNLISEVAMTSYYWGTLPLRVSLRKRMEAAGTAPVCVLFYHRIADTFPNGWTMSNARFEEQIHWLKKNFDVVSLAEAQRRIASGHNDRVSVTITFDDGYAENCERAIPFLLAEEVPFTYFVSYDFAKTGRPFPHDEKAGQPLPPNSLQQLQEMSQAGVDIGAHTRTHPDVGAITSEETLYDEVVRSRSDLSDAIGAPVDYFAFPFGKHENMTDRAFQMAQEAGLLGVCSAYGNYNLPGADPFHIQRIHGDPELVRLKNWLTIDPRKLGRIEEYQVDWEHLR